QRACVMQELPRQSTIFDAVYEAIRDSICDGDLAPGERITQDNIADRLGVSRQPVGQALILLKAQGFVSDAGRRGVVVAPLDAQSVRDIYAIRGALDSLAARLAARRGPDGAARKDGARLIADGRAAVADGASLSTLVRADMAFHEFIYELSGNALIHQSLLTHWQHLRRVMASVIENTTYLDRMWQEHEAILEAIAAGDEARAAELSQSHVERASQALQERLAVVSGSHTHRQ